MRSLRLRNLAILAAGLLLAGRFAATAQEPAASPEGFAETIDVRVVNLEAVVTDKDGRPVRGLTAADFRLLVDGREVPIDYFTEVAGGEAVPAPAADGGADAPVLPPATPAAGRIGRSYLLFLDDSFSIAAQRNTVLKQIEKSLGLLRPEDRMALVAFDGRRLDKVCDWTNDRAALAAAFDRARKRPARGNQALADRRMERENQLITQLVYENEGTGWAGQSGTGLIQGGFTPMGGGSPKAHSQLLRAVDAAAAALRGFPSPPAGRKLLLLLSGGWPEPELLSPLIYDANRLGYTVYPVDVPGTDLMSVADMADHRPGLLATSSWEEGSHESLEVLARATGGRASLNSARLGAFQRAVEDTVSYYWLGFSPAWRADDRHHLVKLEVRRPGLILRSRGSYSDLSPETAEALRNESFLLFGGDGASSRDLWVEIGTPRWISMMVMEVPVRLAFPAALLDLEKAGDDWTAEGELLLGALDIWGVRSNLPVIPLRHRFREAPEPDELVRYRATLRMRRVDQKLVLRVSAPRRGTLLWKELELGPRRSPVSPGAKER